MLLHTVLERKGFDFTGVYLKKGGKVRPEKGDVIRKG